MIKPLSIDGTWLFQPQLFDDARGTFAAWHQRDVFQEATGRSMPLGQANLSTSRRGAIRGIHFADVPPGQAKYITCASGAVRDVVVDLRVGSPTFGRWEMVDLDDQSRQALFLTEGIGHAVQGLTEEATIVYMCSAGYVAERERAIHPLDPDLGIDWIPGVEPILSAKDTVAPTVAEAQEAGLLPVYQP